MVTQLHTANTRCYLKKCTNRTMLKTNRWELGKKKIAYLVLPFLEQHLISTRTKIKTTNAQILAGSATQFAVGLLLPQPRCMRFKLADAIWFVQNKIRDNARMGISFSQPVIPSKSKKTNPLIKVTEETMFPFKGTN